MACSKGDRGPYRGHVGQLFIRSVLRALNRLLWPRFSEVGEGPRLASFGAPARTAPKHAGVFSTLSGAGFFAKSSAKDSEFPAGSWLFPCGVPSNFAKTVLQTAKNLCPAPVPMGRGPYRDRGDRSEAVHRRAYFAHQSSRYMQAAF